jgi:hypothetical protein
LTKRISLVEGPEVTILLQVAKAQSTQKSWC